MVKFKKHWKTAMSFKENIIKKIKINEMSKKVINSLAVDSEGVHRIDKETMRRLLKESSYELKRERELDLYIYQPDNGVKILVLDNALPIYKTTIEDVVLRKSPEIKEMLSIRNIIKILNDKDVVESKGADSVKTIQQHCIEKLDLSFDESDIRKIEDDGKDALENYDSLRVIETIDIFAELLNYSPVPKVFRIKDIKIISGLNQMENKENLFGPIISYNAAQNELKLVNDYIGTDDREKAVNRLHKIILGAEKASEEGKGVFEFLGRKVS